MSPEQWQIYRERAKDVGHVIVFLLGVGAATLGIITANLGLVAAATTLFGLVGIARA